MAAPTWDGHKFLGDLAVMQEPRVRPRQPTLCGPAVQREQASGYSTPAALFRFLCIRRPHIVRLVAALFY
jgi:hypothetical protein